MKHISIKGILRRCAGIFDSRDRKWPVFSDGLYKDYKSLEGDWKKVGTYIQNTIKRENK